VQGVAIHAALIRNHGFGGHYSSVRRFLGKLKAQRIDATMVLDFAPGEATQGYGFLVSPCPPADAAKKACLDIGVEVIRHQGTERRAHQLFVFPADALEPVLRNGVAAAAAQALF